jgi:outer membrane receptor protein involved in Fe transport
MDDFTGSRPGSGRARQRLSARVPRRPGRLVWAAACLVGVPALQAQEVPAASAGGNGEAFVPMEEIVVFGRGTQHVGTAAAASQGSVGGADLLVRPMLKVAEILEAVPGLVAAQHSGSGKANQYFLRGFNLDHGTDFTTYVDGVPWNLRSHGHGQGYLDINGLVPEVVQQIDYRKGPYRADVGDFAMVAASFITTIDRFDAPFVSIESGQRGWGLVAAGGSAEVGEGTLTAIGQYKTYDGPWQQQEGLEHYSVWGKYLRLTRFGDLALTLSGYEGDWHPTEQIPERAIGTAVCADAFCALDQSAGGNTSRWIAAARLNGEDWSASAYLQTYDWYMQSDPTYDFQINQFDQRVTTGGRYDKTLLATMRFDVAVGGEFRYDDISSVGVDSYAAGSFVSNISDNAIQETSLGVYGEATWYATDRLRVLGGLRGDVYAFDVTARTSGSFAGTENDSLATPKLGLAYTLSDRVELYGNWGRGFHSNDARGVVNAASPLVGLSPGTGYETGARFEGDELILTGAYWWLDVDSELIFVGDSNSVEPRGASAREGYELTMFWQPWEGVGFDAVYTGSTANYLDNPEGRYVEGAVEHSGQLGLSAVRGAWEAGLRLRYLGPYALTPDNVHRADPTTTVNLRGAYTFGSATIYAELINALDADGKDITYYYPAYVAGLDPPGLSSEDIDCDVVNCRMSRAQEPRTLRFGVKWAF